MDSGTNQRTFLNGQPATPAALAQVARAFADPQVLAQGAGFLFQAALDGDSFSLAVRPCFANGTRAYHYDIPLRREHAHTVLGGVDTHGAFSLLFRPRQGALSPADRRAYRDACVAFARTLLRAGYGGTGRLDEATRMLWQETRLFVPIPATLHDLVGVPDAAAEPLPP